MPRPAQIAVAQLLMKMDAEQPLLAPAFAPVIASSEDALRSRILQEMYRRTGLEEAGPVYSGWAGFECHSVEAATALMRLVVVSNVLARREETALYLPLNAALDPQGLQAAKAVRLAQTFLTRKSDEQLS
jgi:sirohydrochlorin cobaltochelatase